MKPNRKPTTREVTVYLRDDVEVTAEVSIEYQPAEPDVGIMEGGWTYDYVVKHTAPFVLTPEEEEYIGERAVEEADTDYD
jgi:hypothetical protein